MKYIPCLIAFGFVVLIAFGLLGCPRKSEVAGPVAAAPEATAVQEVVSEAAASPEAAPAPEDTSKEN